MNSKKMQGKDAKKNRKEKNISIEENALRLFDFNNTFEIFSFPECANTAVLMKPLVSLTNEIREGRA